MASLLYNYGYNKDLETLIVLFFVLIIFIILIAIEIFIVVKCYNLAIEKGYSGILWCILALFCGIIALIILAILPTYTRYSPSAWVCPKCGRVKNSSFCLTCNTKKPSSTSTSGSSKTAKPTTAKPKWICPNCGQANNIYASNCINCYEEKK